MLLDVLQSKDLEDNPQHVALVVGVIEAIGAHGERLLWEITHVSDGYLRDLPADGKMLVRKIVDAQTKMFRQTFHRTPAHYEAILKKLDYPGDATEQGRTLWLDTIRKAARVIAEERDEVEAQSFMRHRMNEASFELDVDDEVASMMQDAEVA